MNKWTWNEGRNCYLGQQDSGCFISYNPAPTDTLSILLGGDGTAETALYDGVTWYILNGDFRKEYEELYPDFDACLKFYESKKDKFRNKFSTD